MLANESCQLFSTFLDPVIIQDIIVFLRNHVVQFTQCIRKAEIMSIHTFRRYSAGLIVYEVILYEITHLYVG